MGKSAIELVLANRPLVAPKGDQPPYVRGKRVIQTSAKLKRHQSCVASELKGKKFGSRAEARKAFTAASAKCKGK